MGAGDLLGCMSLAAGLLGPVATAHGDKHTEALLMAAMVISTAGLGTLVLQGGTAMGVSWGVAGGASAAQTPMVLRFCLTAP